MWVVGVVLKLIVLEWKDRAREKAEMASQAVKRGVPEERLAGARRRGRELDEEARLRHSREEAAEALDAPGGGRGPRRAPRSSGGRDQTGRGVRGGSPARLAAPRIAGGGAEPVPRHQEGSCGPRGRRAQSSAPPLQIHALSKLCPGAGATALPAGGGPAALSSSAAGGGRLGGGGGRLNEEGWARGKKWLRPIIRPRL